MASIIKAARGRITTYHGEDIGRDAITGAKGHVGIDIGHGDGTSADLRIGAPAAGRITANGIAGSYGRRVIITHDDGSWSLIAHLAESIGAGGVGNRVEQNQHIGTMGNSGTQFVHAHQEYHRASGAAVDPLDYMTTASGGTAKEIEDMPLTPEDLTAISERIRKSVWFLGPDGEPITVETALKDLANRQVGYGYRVELMHTKSLPALPVQVANEVQALLRGIPVSGELAEAGPFSLPDSDRDDIAERVANKLAARLRE